MACYLCFSTTRDEPQVVCNQKTLEIYTIDIGMRNWSTLIRNVIYILTLYECAPSLIQFINFSLIVTKILPSETESNNYEFLEKCEIVHSLYLAVIYFIFNNCYRRSLSEDVREIESHWGRDFTHIFRPVLKPTKPPLQWAPHRFVE